jgi:hypothetical protein
MDIIGVRLIILNYDMTDDVDHLYVKRIYLVSHSYIVIENKRVQTY